DASTPDVEADASTPNVEADASTPDVEADASTPDVGADLQVGPRDRIGIGVYEGARMPSRVWSVAVLVACACGTAGAQTVLTEADAIAKLSADSPRVRALRSGIALARAEVLSASRWPTRRLYVGRDAVAGVCET